MMQRAPVLVDRFPARLIARRGGLLVLVALSFAAAFGAAHARTAAAQNLGVEAYTAQDVERITLQEALRRYRQNSAALRLARAEAAEAEGRLRQETAYANPSVSVTHEPLYRGDETQSETYVNLSQRLAWPGRRSAEITAAEGQLEAARARSAADSLAGAFEVARAYAQAAAAEERAAALRTVTEVFAASEERGERRLEAGDFAGYSLRRVRIERARYENDQVRAALDVQAARQQLALLIAPRDSDALAFAPATDLDAAPEALTLEAMLEAARARRPQLRAARAEVEAARAARRAARLRWIPDPTLTAGYKRQSNGFEGVFLGASIPIPLFDRGRGASEAGAARLRAAEARLGLLQRRIETDVRTAFARYAAFRARLAQLQEDLRAEAADLGAADNLLDAAQVSYAEGEMSLVELLDAATAFREARLVTTDLLADTWTSYFDLKRAAGLFPTTPVPSSLTTRPIP